MKQEKNPPTVAEELRERAELELGGEELLPEEMSPERMREIIHELRVHQVELHMQNEALRTTTRELEESRERFSDLYDFAPVGYVTLDSQGLILEANLTPVPLAPFYTELFFLFPIGLLSTYQTPASWPDPSVSAPSSSAVSRSLLFPSSCSLSCMAS